MPWKILSMILAVALFVGYFMPIVVKLGDLALAAVVAGGIAFVLLDAWKALAGSNGA